MPWLQSAPSFTALYLLEVRDRGAPDVGDGENTTVPPKKAAFAYTTNLDGSHLELRIATTKNDMLGEPTKYTEQKSTRRNLGKLKRKKSKY